LFCAPWAASAAAQINARNAPNQKLLQVIDSMEQGMHKAAVGLLESTTLAL
jgi:hypothetical protein